MGHSRTLLSLLPLVLCACTAAPPGPGADASEPVPSSAVATPASPSTAATLPPPTPASSPPLLPVPFRNPLPGMPPVVGGDVYAATRAGMLSPVVAHDPALLYVPDSGGRSVTVIAQRTHKIVRVVRAGQLSQHVTPSYDLRRLYTDSSAANRLVGINPNTGRRSGSIVVPRPYNLYFSPDGRQAIVMTEQHNQIRFSNPRSFRLIAARSDAGCRGPNHADFSANGQYFLVTCEFSGAILKVATASHRILGLLKLGRDSMPQDIRISPDGRLFYVAAMGKNRVELVDGWRLKVVGHLRTPTAPHGLYPSRTGRLLYVSDRGAGKVSVISFAQRRIVATWRIPGGGSPDMGGVSANGRMLWLTGRYDGVVYGFDTKQGRLVAKIKVGGRPHGMAVWPQPGRYSLGHTGNMR